MDPCKFSFDIDIGACGKSVAVGLVPDWVWGVLAALPWIFGTLGVIIALLILIKAYRFGGWPAVIGVVGVTAGGVIGFMLTRGGSKPQPAAADPKEARRRRPTMFGGAAPGGEERRDTLPMPKSLSTPN